MQLTQGFIPIVVNFSVTKIITMAINNCTVQCVPRNVAFTKWETSADKHKLAPAKWKTWTCINKNVHWQTQMCAGKLKQAQIGLGLKFMVNYQLKLCLDKAKEEKKLAVWFLCLRRPRFLTHNSMMHGKDRRRWDGHPETLYHRGTKSILLIFILNSYGRRANIVF